jgi:hypothetical protein
MILMKDEKMSPTIEDLLRAPTHAKASFEETESTSEEMQRAGEEKFDEFFQAEDGEQTRNRLDELYKERAKDEKKYLRY